MTPDQRGKTYRAALIDENWPDWVVLYDHSTDQFIAFPRPPTTPPEYMRPVISHDPDHLEKRMTQTWRRIILPQPTPPSKPP